MRESMFEVGTTYRDRGYHKVVSTLRDMGLGTHGQTYARLLGIISAESREQLLEAIRHSLGIVSWSLIVMTIEESFRVKVRQQGDSLYIGFDEEGNILVEDFTGGAYRRDHEG